MAKGMGGKLGKGCLIWMPDFPSIKFCQLWVKFPKTDCKPMPVIAISKVRFLPYFDDFPSGAIA